MLSKIISDLLAALNLMAVEDRHLILGKTK